MNELSTSETDAVASRLICNVSADFARKLKYERDEVMKEINIIRNTLSKNGEAVGNGEYDFSIIEMVENLMQSKHYFVRKSDSLERERDEARESLKHIGEYGTEEINAAVELRQKLATALVERDEAREDLEHWKIEYEIVVSRLCGIKHERDNGIIAEHEIIPKLQRERDEALEKLSARWQSLRDSQDEVLRLTFENRELRNLSNE